MNFQQGGLIVSYKINVISHIVAVSVAVLFLYLKKKAELYCLYLTFSCIHFIPNFIVLCNFAQITCLVN